MTTDSGGCGETVRTPGVFGRCHAPTASLNIGGGGLT
jgi:hypothetical protein